MCGDAFMRRLRGHQPRWLFCNCLLPSVIDWFRTRSFLTVIVGPRFCARSFLSSGGDDGSAGDRSLLGLLGGLGGSRLSSGSLLRSLGLLSGLLLGRSSLLRSGGLSRGLGDLVLGLVGGLLSLALALYSRN